MENLHEKNLKDLERFFKINMKIKESIFNIAPDKSFLSEKDETTRIKYSDDLFNSCNDIEEYFQIICGCFNLVEYKDDLKKKFSEIKERLINSGYGGTKLEQTYRDVYSDMRPEFVEKVKDSLKGYYGFRDSEMHELINEATTFNELLHCVHSYVINNEKILQSVSIVAQKKTNMGETITLYGDMNESTRGLEMAQSIYDKISDDMRCGSTDVVATKNKILMMVRDMGHALTFEIDIGKDNSLVKYFIPKICNVEMVNQLKGIDSTSKKLYGVATGMYEVDSENLSDEVVETIKNVPEDRDADRDISNNTLYDEMLKQDNLNFKTEEVKTLAKTRKLDKIIKIFEPFKRAADKFRSMFNSKRKDGDEKDVGEYDK